MPSWSLLSGVAATSPDGLVTWLIGALAAVAGSLATVAGVAWRQATNTVADLRAELVSTRADLKAANGDQVQLVRSMMEDIVPAMTRMTDATQRATEALISRGRR